MPLALWGLRIGDSFGNQGNLSWMPSALWGQITTSFFCLLCFAPFFSLCPSSDIVTSCPQCQGSREEWKQHGTPWGSTSYSLRRRQEQSRHYSTGLFQCSFKKCGERLSIYLPVFSHSFKQLNSPNTNISHKQEDDFIQDSFHIPLHFPYATLGCVALIKRAILI